MSPNIRRLERALRCGSPSLGRRLAGRGKRTASREGAGLTGAKGALTAAAITVLIADDHPVVRQGLRTFLDIEDDIEDDIEVVGEAADGPAAR